MQSMFVRTLFTVVFFLLYMKKIFFAFPRDLEKSPFSANDRLHTLLDWTGLTNRFITGDESVESQLKKNFSREVLKEKVDAKRRESMKYLNNALEGLKHA